MIQRGDLFMCMYLFYQTWCIWWLFCVPQFFGQLRICLFWILLVHAANMLSKLCGKKTIFLSQCQLLLTCSVTPHAGFPCFVSVWCQNIWLCWREESSHTSISTVENTDWCSLLYYYAVCKPSIYLHQAFRMQVSLTISLCLPTLDVNYVDLVCWNIVGYLY